jgi:His-Xaa-Ser system protein HxsD
MTEEDSILDNIEIHKNFAIISVNPKMYPLSVIYSAAYWLLDRVHVLIDGDPETEVLVEIRPKKEQKVDLKEIGYEFNDELINYSVYTVQATRNKKLREMIVENALAGNLKGSQQFNQPQNSQTQRCDYPQQKFQGGEQMSASWKPGDQPLDDDNLRKFDEKVNPTKNDEFFKGTQGIDKENISEIKDYRNKSKDFSGVR